MFSKSLGWQGAWPHSQSGNSFSVTWPRRCGSREPVIWWEPTVKLGVLCSNSLKHHQPVAPLLPLLAALLPPWGWGSAPPGNWRGPTGRGRRLHKGLRMGDIVWSASFRLTAGGRGGVAWLTRGSRGRVGGCGLEPLAWTSCGAAGGDGMLGKGRVSAGSEAGLRLAPVRTVSPEPGSTSWCSRPALIVLLRPSIALASWIVILATWCPLPAFKIRWLMDESSLLLLVPEKQPSLSPSSLSRRTKESLVLDVSTSAAASALTSAAWWTEPPWSGPGLVGGAAPLWLPVPARSSEESSCPPTRPRWETGSVFVSSVSTRSFFFLDLELKWAAGGDWV